MNVFVLRIILGFAFISLFVQCFRGLPLPQVRYLKITSKPKTLPLSTFSNFKHNIPLYFKTSDNDMFGRINTEKNIPTEFDENQEDFNENDCDDESIDSHRSSLYESKVMNILSKSLIPISTSLGFALAPSSKLTIRLASAAAGGMVGLGAKQSIGLFAKKSNIHADNDMYDNDSNGDGPSISASRALEQLKREYQNLLTMSTKDIEYTAKRNRVPEKHLSLLFTILFSEAVYDVLVSSSMDLTELTDIMNFADSISLTPAEVGNGLAFAAIKLSGRLEKDERGFYKDEYPEEILHQAAKLLFLTDKMIGIEEGYYGRRMIPALSFFTIESYAEVITKACKELFHRCIEDVLVSPGNYQTGEVEELKEFLTVSRMISDFEPAMMESMVAEAVQSMLDRTLPLNIPPMQACVKNYDVFVQAQKVLGGARSVTTTAAGLAEWMQPLQARTSPLFEAAVQELFKTVTNHPERAVELSEVMRERVESLRIESHPAQALIVKLVDDRNRDYMNRINKVYNVSGGAIEPSYKIMLSYAHTHAALKNLTSLVMKDRDLPLPGLPFPEIVRAHIYQMQLNRSSKRDGKHATNIHEIDTEMFALTPEQQQIVRKHLALPKLTAWISQCLQENNFNTGAKAAYVKQLQVNNVTAEEWQATALDFYHEEVKTIAQTKEIPTLADVDRLLKIKEFLNCSSELVDRVHLNLMGDKYVKALTECMAPTGVLSEEDLEGLSRLSERLGLNKTHTDALFAVAARARITPIIKDLVDIWKSDTDANYRTEKAKEKMNNNNKENTNSSAIIENKNMLKKEREHEGQDAFMREVLHLMTFLTENYNLLQKEVTGAELHTLSITAEGIVSPQDLAGLFKHYMIQKLSEQNPELMNRYQDMEELFGRVLGIESKDQMKMKESVLYTLYKRMLTNVLQSEDRVDTQIVSFFVQLRDALGVEHALSERIHTEATQAAMLTHTALLFRGSTQSSPLTPDTARRLRSQVESLGLDWRADLGFSDALISYLYALELQLTIESGATEGLSDLQSAYNIPELRAAELLEATCKRHISQMLNLALRAAKKYDERDTLIWLKRILLYVPYVQSAVDADGNLFAEADKERLISFYQAETESGDDEELVVLAGRIEGDVQDRLRGLIHLSGDFVPPAQGMAGLMGQGQTLAQLEANLNVDQGRKEWAWG